jgi:hypothetical protein
MDPDDACPVCPKAYSPEEPLGLGALQETSSVKMMAVASVGLVFFFAGLLAERLRRAI